MKLHWIKRAAVCVLALVLLAMPAFATVGGATVNNISGGLNLRQEANTSSGVVEVLNSGDFLLVEEKLDGWYKVVHNGTSGYVSADYVTFAETLDGTYDYAASTAGTDVNMRAGSATWCWLLKTLPYTGTALTVTGVSGNWLKVRDAAGAEGFIRSDLVNYVGKKAASTTTTASNGYSYTPQTYNVTYNGTAGDKIVQTAMQYLGYRYVWGGMSPSVGFDCSGFVNYVYSQNGYSLNRVAQDIYNGSGWLVDSSSMQPGDILCFGWSIYSIGHVGIYIGNGQFIHACSSTTGVIVSNLTDGYYTARLMGVKRVVT
jgi:N-acetylmuramoyl-L-alanine amidase